METTDRALSPNSSASTECDLPMTEMTYLIRIIESVLPQAHRHIYLASLDKNVFWDGEIEGQCGRILSNRVVVLLGNHCCISEVF